MDLQAGAHRAVDDFYTGTVAAACGGTTTIVDHMAFGPKGCSLWHQVEEYHRLADGKAVIDYGFHGVLQHVDERVLREMGELADREGITSFKAYLTYDDRLDDGALFQVLRQAKEDGIVTMEWSTTCGAGTRPRASPSPSTTPGAAPPAVRRRR